MTAIGYKEWSLVCGALGSGCQHVLLRKGGIAEGRDGFAFKHEQFFLFPSHFHEQSKHLRLRDEEAVDDPKEGEIVVRFFAVIDEVFVLESWEQALALEPFHVWKRELVRERFDYGDASRLHCAIVRVFRLPGAWRFPTQRSFGGCRSWLELPEPPVSEIDDMWPVVDRESFGNLKKQISEAISVSFSP